MDNKPKEGHLQAELEALQRENLQLQEQISRAIDEIEGGRRVEQELKSSYEMRLGTLLVRFIRPFVQWRKKLVRKEAAALREPGVVSAEEPGLLRSQYDRLDAYWKSFQPPPRVSIILPVHNGIAYTRACVASILRSKVDVSFELVVVNNGSTDGSEGWLKLVAAQNPNVTVINNATDPGFGTAVNQGVEASRGDYVVVARNDVLMPVSWLKPLVEAADQDPGLGILSPVTNRVEEAGVQLDVQAQGIQAAQVEAFGWEAAGRDLPVRKVSEPLSFFTVLIRRELFDLLGGAAGAAYPGGYFTEADFCSRARLAGYTLGVAPTSFVFQQDTDSDRLGEDELTFQSNQIVYYERLINFATHLSPTWTGKPGEKVDVSVVVRTQNRRRWLVQALTSLANQTYRDFEVVLVNDGGEDCADLVQQFSQYMNLQYIFHPQPHGRGAALNAGWQNAKGRWVTYLDDDDLVFPFHLELLTHALSQDPAARVVYSYGQKALCLRGETEDIPLARLPMIQKEFRPEALFVENSIPIMAMMHERSLAVEAGGFDESLEVLEDWDFIIRMAQRAEFRLAPHLTAEYRFYVGMDLQNSIVKRRSELLPTIRKLYARYPVDDASLSAQRAQVLQSVEAQLAELEEIQAMDGDAQLKNLMVLMRTSGFTLGFFRHGGFRA